MSKRRTAYPPEFRRQMVELVRSGRNPEELSREFEPTAQAIRNWVAQADRDEGRRADGLTTAERQELSCLRRENRQLRIEREILSKAGGLVRSGDRIDPLQGFEFVKANQADYPGATLCRILGVSTSGYYAWRGRPPSERAQSDARWVERIRVLHQRSRGSYGTPRILEDLQEEGERLNHKRVARLMRSAGLVGISRRKGFKTTVRDRDARPAPDLVKRCFTAERPDQLWVADITYVPTLAGFLFLAVVMDVFSRRIVGWAMATHLRTELILEALNMAIYQRRPRDVIHHSDQGTQYTSIAFGARCREAGVRPSMGSVGDCFDNAMCESFFATLECELLDRRRFETQAEAKMAVFEFIEGWYNPHRRHSSIDYLSPVNYERKICPTRTPQPLQCPA
ncbi:MAG: IS3 family transposase [Actinobacteria bacterium]|nr:IS3 family transposase [Actinomycetota bacterium]